MCGSHVTARRFRAEASIARILRDAAAAAATPAAPSLAEPFDAPEETLSASRLPPLATFLQFLSQQQLKAARSHAADKQLGRRRRSRAADRAAGWIWRWWASMR